MSPKRKRMRFVIGSMLVASMAMGFILSSFRDQLIFFYTPTQWQAKSAEDGIDPRRPVRIGGIVKSGSIRHGKNQMLRFVVTDLTHELAVTYHGIPPALFREGQGVVAQGTVDASGMHASTILAKHDENYMPREVVEQLKKSGRWQESGGR